MTLSDSQFKLYHGTDAELAPGDTVGARKLPGRSTAVAFASKFPVMAQNYAQHIRPQEGQQSMFGHVYEVEPQGEVTHGPHESTSTEGFKVVRHVSSHAIRSRDDDY